MTNAPARPSKRNATAMGKRIAEHVMMHAGETAKLEACRDLPSGSGAPRLARVAEEARLDIVRHAMATGLAVVALRPVEYAVVADFLDPEKAGWTAEPPEHEAMPPGSWVRLRAVAYAVPVLEVK